MFRGLVPLPSHYAVIRTDPEAMLKDLGLDDPETLAEAKDMSRKKYLVFLEWPEELPMPGMRWCRYDVCPIGTTLRPPDESRGITSDMVVPIAPNKGHTPDRHPVHTTPSFPFSNCYHWIFNSVSVRARVHEDGVEHDGAIRLSPKEHNTMNDTFFPDAQRVGTFLHEKYGASSATEEKKPEQVAAASACDDDAQGTGLPVEASAQDGDPAHILSDIYRRLVTQRGLRKSGPPSHGDDKSQPRLSSSSKDASGSHDAEKQSTITPVTSRDSGIDLFGWDPDPNTARIPLVDAWLDIDKHFTEDDITSPVELKKEFEQIDALIMRGLARFASTQKSPEQIKAEHPVGDTELPAEPEELADDNHLVDVLTGLWLDLQSEYVTSSSSCGPPFPMLDIPESNPDDTTSILPRLTTGYGPFPSYPLPGDVRFPVPEAGDEPTPSPASASNSLTPHSASPTRSPRLRFAGPAVPPPSPSPLSSLRISAGSPAVPSVAPPSSKLRAKLANVTSKLQPTTPPRRRSRASTIIHQLRTKVEYFWHHSGRIGEVH